MDSEEPHSEPNRTSANSSTLTDALFTVLRARTPASFTSLFNDLETRLKPRFLALETRLTHLKWSKYLQDKTGVNATYWTVGGGLLAAAVFRIMLHIAASLVSNIVGFVYPAYASIKSIEGGDKEENSHWLTYWTVFGSFSVAEYFSGFILRWIPFYYTGKIALLVWCMHPRTRGAGLIYRKIIRPLFYRYHLQIDDAMNKGSHEINGIVQRSESAVQKGTREIQGITDVLKNTGQFHNPGDGN